MERKGIVSMGNWLVDSVKFIDVYPAKGNLTTITDVEVGLWPVSKAAFRYMPAVVLAGMHMARWCSTP